MQQPGAHSKERRTASKNYKLFTRHPRNRLGVLAERHDLLVDA